MNDTHVNESILSEEILEDQKKNRIDHMTYLPGMENIGSEIMDQVIEAMEMGAAAVMANTAIATAGNVEEMAEAFKKAIEAGRSAYLSGLGRILDKGASASSPLTGFLHE